MSVRKEIRIVIADDHQLVREGLASIIGRQDGMTVVKQVADGESAVASVVALLPDVLLLDVQMPGPPVGTTVRRVRRLAPDVHVIVLTMHRERALRHELMKDGASAYLLKSDPSTTIVTTIVSVSALPMTALSVAKGDDSFGLLSPREAMVLTRLTTGSTTAHIAADLAIAPGTVKRHLSNIYGKLGADTRMDAINKARILGYLD